MKSLDSSSSQLAERRLKCVHSPAAWLQLWRRNKKCICDETYLRIWLPIMPLFKQLLCDRFPVDSWQKLNSLWSSFIMNPQCYCVSRSELPSAALTASCCTDSFSSSWTNLDVHHPRWEHVRFNTLILSASPRGPTRCNRCLQIICFPPRLPCFHPPVHL